MTKEHLKILKIVGVIILIVLSILSYIFIQKIQNFEKYNKYFNQAIENQRVELWMNFNQVERIYHIDIEKVLGKKLGLFEMKEPISKYCEKNSIDCNNLILELNKIKNEH
ncbi:MAG: hypothetical protein PHG82_02590 [Candidatus Gracilibacteria bacterium]|nr:hypothetical protein [Candidatus Gracilibacteria bacterium]